MVVGLGNPGDAYAGTRHNAGRWAVRELARRHGASLRRARREHSLVADLRLDGHRVTAATPLTYMNESGRAVAPLVRRHGINDLSNLVIAHDELDLPVGRLKVKTGGGLSGHKGLKSVRAHLRDDGFTRIRIGIGRPGLSADAGSVSRFGRSSASTGRVHRQRGVSSASAGRPGLSADAGSVSRFGRSSASAGRARRQRGVSSASTGRARRQRSVVEYVLSRPAKSERAELDRVILRAADAVECFLLHGLETTMNRFNGI